MRAILLAALALSACGGLLGPDEPDADGVDAKVDSQVVAIDGSSIDGAFADVIDAGEVDVALPVSFVDSVQIADVTNDGRADVVVATITNGARAVAVVAQRPDGTLADPIVYGLPNNGWVEVGDVTGDGLTDIIGNASSGVGVLPQSDAGFGAPSIFKSPDGGAGTPIPGRFDDGGLGVASLLSSALDLFVQDAGALVFASELAMPLYWNEFAIGDVTGDGLDDCVGATFNGSIDGIVSVAAQSAPLTLAPPKSYVYGYNDGGFADYMPTGLAVGDVTGDGLADVVVSYGGNKPDSHVTVLAQQGGVLGAPVVYPSLDIPETVRIADMNGDHRLDVIVSHGGWGHVGIYLQGNGALGTEQLFPFETFVGHGPCIAVGDINGDGHPDVVGIASAGANQIALLLSAP